MPSHKGKNRMIGFTLSRFTEHTTLTFIRALCPSNAATIGHQQRDSVWPAVVLVCPLFKIVYLESWTGQTLCWKKSQHHCEFKRRQFSPGTLSNAPPQQEGNRKTNHVLRSCSLDHRARHLGAKPHFHFHRNANPCGGLGKSLVGGHFRQHLLHMLLVTTELERNHGTKHEVIRGLTETG